ncbi:MAG: hypothetical protein ABI811_13825 [Acidobacteriota bacterium]
MKTASPKPARQNVTLSLPGALLRRFRVYAAERNQSMTSLAAQAITQLIGVNDEDAHEKAKQRFLERIRNPIDRGTGEKLPTREESWAHMRDKP